MIAPYFDPEPPVEPPEPEVVLECDNCGTEIYEGDNFFDLPNVGSFCEDCMNNWRAMAEIPQERSWL